MQFSTWRRTDVECNGTNKNGGFTQVDFFDTTPNMFIVHNKSNVELLCSINRPVLSRTNIDGSISYRGDFKIKANGFTVIGYPMPTNKLFFFNIVPTQANITVFSIYDKFDINIFKDFNAELTDVNVNTDGVVKNFTCSLPSGNNKIGKVEVTNLSSDNSKLVLSPYSGEQAFLYGENMVLQNGEMVIFETLDIINNPTDNTCNITVYLDTNNTVKLHVTIPPHSFLSNVTDLPVYKIAAEWEKGDGYIEIIGKIKEG